MASNKRFVAKNGLDNNSNTIINLLDPVSAQDAATKNYIDITFAPKASPTFTGTVTLPSFIVNGNAGSNRVVTYRTSGSSRWLAGAGADTESGSNSGSNYYISSYADDGVTMTNRLVINRSTGNVSLSNGLSLDNGVSNLIKFGNNGAGTPTFTTRTPGTKILIWDTLSASAVDYAIGFTGGTFWNSIPTSTDQFRWFAGTSVSATLTGAGALTVADSVTISGTTGLNLSASGSNLISFNTSGVAAPTFTTRSTGTKIVLYPGISASSVDFAFGISGSTLWSSVPSAGSQFQWYGATTVAATLTGSGVLYLNGGLNVQSGDMRVFTSSGSAGGTIYFGGGSKFLTCDGTNYAFNTGVVTTNGFLQVTAGGTPNFAVNDGSSGAQIQTTNGYASNIAFHIPGYAATKFGLNSSFQFEWGGWSMAAGRMYLDNSGNLTCAGNVTAYSDARLKTNIFTIDNALSKVLSLRGVEYDRIDNGEHEIGLIAQEVQAIIPEVVLVGKDENQTLSLDYGKLVGLLIEAIKEQQIQINKIGV